MLPLSIYVAPHLSWEVIKVNPNFMSKYRAKIFNPARIQVQIKNLSASLEKVTYHNNNNGLHDLEDIKEGANPEGRFNINAQEYFFFSR